ncbi:hypothetical protein CERSUDRAFT_91778 [Gelatoporia subvermispora B]|uniref:Uncharacterized protein n=1 Tax=Ceriporiopsis subvermispora (strain B) TaxID=914234 RepID=M2QV97_CERS8|nr:hypothetical protein CERSUDRAFT_91778 [Gelatoporia subvermispora B]
MMDLDQTHFRIFTGEMRRLIYEVLKLDKRMWQQNPKAVDEYRRRAIEAWPDLTNYEKAWPAIQYAKTHIGSMLKPSARDSGATPEAHKWKILAAHQRALKLEGCIVQDEDKGEEWSGLSNTVYSDPPPPPQPPVQKNISALPSQPSQGALSVSPKWSPSSASTFTLVSPPSPPRAPRLPLPRRRPPPLPRNLHKPPFTQSFSREPSVLPPDTDTCTSTFAYACTDPGPDTTITTTAAGAHTILDIKPKTSLQAFLASLSPPLHHLHAKLAAAGLATREDLASMADWSERERCAFLRESVELSAFDAIRVNRVLANLGA